MKIKLVYPKIPNTLHCPLKQCFAFEKIDGTNLHFVWNSQDGFHSFGTRRDQFSYDRSGLAQFHQAHPGMDGLEEAIERDILPIYTDRYLSSSNIIFAELVGPNSFAGSHDPKDEKRLVIFDVQVNGAMVPPDQFIKCFGDLSVPKVVYQGKFTGQLFKDVRAGKYDVKEGVVVKGMVGGQIYMAKIKTKKYLQKLKDRFGNKWQEYGE